MNGDIDSIMTCEFSPDGERLLTTTRDAVRLWDGQTGSLLALLSHSDPFAGSNWRLFPRAIFDATGSQVVTTSNDLTARLWNAKTGAAIAVLAGHRGELNGVSFSLDGARILTASRDRTARVWNAFTRGEGLLENARLDADATRDLLVTSFNTVHLRPWQEAGGISVSVLNGSSERIVGAGSGRAVTVSDDGIPRLWNAVTGATAKLTGHKHGVTEAVFNKDGTRVVTFYASPGLNADGKWPEFDPPRLWDTESNRLVAILEGHSEDVLAAAFSPDRTTLVTTSKYGTAWVWNAQTGQPLKELTGERGAVFSPRGERLITYGSGSAASLWSTVDWALVTDLPHGGEVTGATFSPDGTTALTASLDGSARLWDSNTGTERAVLDHEDYVHEATFSRSGTRIITASKDQKAKVWDNKGALIATLNGHRDTVWTAALTADGTRAVTGSEDGSSVLWNASTGRSDRSDRAWTWRP